MKEENEKTTQQRRSTRIRKPVYEMKNLEEDRLLRVALKRSQLEAHSPLTLASSDSATNFFTRLPVVPTINPTWDEFNDPIGLWQQLNSIGTEYGAVKLIPPDGWKPPFSLDLNKLTFKTREQLVHRLASGNAFKFPKTFWTATQFKENNDKFKLQYVKNHSNAVNGNVDPQYKRDTMEWEIEYWRLVETQSTPVTVLYGADIEVSDVGSGFPAPPSFKAASSLGVSSVVVKHQLDDKNNSPSISTNGKNVNGVSGKKKQHEISANINSNNEDDFYANHPWNLLNLPKVDGSLLQTFPRIVPGNQWANGVTCPWIYIGMLFSSFCWHTEDNYFAAVNYQHLGDEKVWYVIPPNQAPLMENLMREYLGHKKPEEVLHSLTVQLSPALLVQNGITVNRIVQKKNEYILLWPRTFHCGFNTGFNCNEACNVAPPMWLDWGHFALSSYRYLRSMCIPYEQLIYMAASNGKITRIEMLEKLIEALARLISEDYSLRYASNLRQAPLIPSRYLSQYLPPLDGRRHMKSNFSMGFTRRSAGDSIRLREVFNALCTNSVDLYRSGDDEFIEQFNALTRLPCLDCDHCKSACYQGFVSCPHTSEVFCLPCVNELKNIECRCTFLTFIYRFPLSAQLRVLEKLQQELNKSKDCLPTCSEESQKNNSISEYYEGDELDTADPPKVSETGSYIDLLPTKRTVEVLERCRSAPIELGYVGPFIWRYISSGSLFSPERNALTTEESKDSIQLSSTTTVAETKALPRRSRGRPRLRPIGSSISKTMGSVPADLPSLVPEQDFRDWLGLKSRSSSKFHPPSKEYDIYHSGIGDVIQKLSSRHLYTALLEELETDEESTTSSDNSTSDEELTSEDDSESDDQYDKRKHHLLHKRRKLEDGKRKDLKTNQQNQNLSRSSNESAIGGSTKSILKTSGNNEELIGELKKRGRGRPAKFSSTGRVNKTSPAINSVVAQEQDRMEKQRVIGVTKRGRGRPRKESYNQTISKEECTFGRELPLEKVRMHLENLDNDSVTSGRQQVEQQRKRSTRLRERSRGYNWLIVQDSDPEKIHGVDTEDPIDFDYKFSYVNKKSSITKQNMSNEEIKESDLIRQTLSTHVDNGMKTEISSSNNLPSISSLLQSAAQEAHSPTTPVLTGIFESNPDPSRSVSMQPAPKSPQMSKSQRASSIESSASTTDSYGMPFSDTRRLSFDSTFVTPQRQSSVSHNFHSPITPDELSRHQLMTNETQSETFSALGTSSPSAARLLMENGELLLNRANKVVAEDERLRNAVFSVYVNLTERDIKLRTDLEHKIEQLDCQIEELKQSILVIQALMALQPEMDPNFSIIDANLSTNPTIANAIKNLVIRLISPQMTGISKVKETATTAMPSTSPVTPVLLSNLPNSRPQPSHQQHVLQNSIINFSSDTFPLLKKGPQCLPLDTLTSFPTTSVYSHLLPLSMVRGEKECQQRGAQLHNNPFVAKRNPIKNIRRDDKPMSNDMQDIVMGGQERFSSRTKTSSIRLPESFISPRQSIN